MLGCLIVVMMKKSFWDSLCGIKQELYAKSFQVNDIRETYLPTLKTHVVNLKRDAKDLSRDLQWLKVCDKLVSKLSIITF